MRLRRSPSPAQRLCPVPCIWPRAQFLRPAHPPPPPPLRLLPAAPRVRRVGRPAKRPPGAERTARGADGRGDDGRPDGGLGAQLELAHVRRQRARQPRPRRQPAGRQHGHAAEVRGELPPRAERDLRGDRGARRRVVPRGRVDAAGRRRRDLARALERQRLREGGVLALRRLRHDAAGGARVGDDARRRPRGGLRAGRARALLRVRAVVGDAPAHPDGADDALQLPLLRDRRRRLVVWRRLRPDAVVPLRGGRQALPRHIQGGVRQARRRVLPALQEVGRRVLLHQAPRRDPRPRRHLL